MSSLRRTESRESVLSSVSCVSGVGNWEVGDRVKCDGRPGTISFIGTTQFAPGEWVGLTLDTPDGKNDGSVQGIRYFECTDKHGLFCKSGKLERLPGQRHGPISPHAEEFGFDIGDRVNVPGGKIGTLRFLDKTSFAQGVWAGVELDQPVGKNDGSVQGHRYFVCKPLYGLFAPASKTELASTQSPSRLKAHHTKSSLLRYSQKHGGSRESLSSVGASSLASSRIGLGVRRTSALRSVTSPTSAFGTDSAIQTLQAALKEKELHLEQLMKEREMERMEMARLLQGSERSPTPVEAVKAVTDNMKTKLLERENTIEDLKFRMEEEMALRDARIEELEQEIVKRAVGVEPPDSQLVNAEIETKFDVVMKENEALKNQLVSYDISSQTVGAKVAELEALLRDRETSIAKYEAQVTEGTNRIADLESQLETQQARSMSESKNVDDKFADLEAALRLKEKVICELQASDASCASQIAEKDQLLAAAAADSEKALSDAVSKIGQLERELQDEKMLRAKQASESNDKLASAESAVQALSEKVASNEADVRLREEETCQLKDKLANLEVELRLKEKAIYELEASNASYVTQMAEKDLLVAAAAADSGKALSDAVSKIGQLERELQDERALRTKQETEFIEKLASAEYSIEALSEKVASTEVDVRLREEETCQLKANISALQCELDAQRKLNKDESEMKVAFETELQQQVVLLQQEKDSLETSMKSLEASSAEAKLEFSKTVEDLSKAREESEERCANLDKELCGLRIQLEHMQSAERDLKTELTKVTASKKDELAMAAQLLHDREKALEERVAAASASVLEASDNVKRLESELAAALSSLTSESGRTESLSSSLAETTAKLDTEIARREEVECALRREKDERAADLDVMDSAKLGGDQLAIDLAEAKRETVEERGRRVDLQEKMIKTEENVRTLETELAVVRGEKQALEVQQREEIETHKKTLDECKTRIAVLEQEKSTATKALQESQAVAAKQKEHCEGLEAELTTKIEVTQHLEQRLTESQSLLSEKEKQVAELVSQSQLQLEKIQLLEKRTDEQLNIINENANDRCVVADELLLARKDNEALRNELDEAINYLVAKTNQFAIEKEKICGEKAEAEKAASDALAARQRIEAERISERDALKAEIETQAAKIATLEQQLSQGTDASAQQLAVMSHDKLKLNEELQLSVANLARLSEEKEKESKRFEETSNEVAVLKETIATLSSQLNMREAEINQNKEEVSRLQIALDNNEALEREKNSADEKIVMLSNEISELRSKLLDNQVSPQMEAEFGEAMVQVKSLAAEKKQLQDEVAALQESLKFSQLKESDLLSREREASSKMELWIELDQEWRKKEARFVEKIEELNLKLDMAQRRTASDEVVTLTQQVDFLNSIIADKNKKEKNLKDRIAELEDCDFLTTNHDSAASNTKREKKKAPRLWCDICETFDAHDTEDCPTQASEMAEYEAHTHVSSTLSPEGKKTNQKIRPPPREYCDNCEEFGHDTASSDCPKRPKKKDYTF